MSNFWLKFIITEAIGAAEAFVAVSNIKPALKTALEKLIADGQAVIASI
jgi:hypothetical protein